jgi:predicted PolB exonuclease-like 3'-5' exonuclease
MNKIDTEFLAFHSSNPHIMDAIVRYTRQLITAGHKHFGMGAVFERIRWDYAVSTLADTKGFKINNNYRSRYVRLLEATHPQFKGFYRQRKVAEGSMFNGPS